MLKDAIEAKDAELAALRARLAQAEASLRRYRYAVYWTATDSWDFCQDCRKRFEWARANDPDGQLSINDAAAIGKDFLAQESRAWLDAAPAAEAKGGDACDREPGRAHKTTPQPVEPPAGADVEVGEWRKIFRTPSPTEPTEGEVEAAARVFCSGLPPDSNAAASTPAGMIAKGRCWAPECNCWEEGKELTRAALRAAARARAPQGG